MTEHRYLSATLYCKCGAAMICEGPAWSPAKWRYVCHTRICPEYGVYYIVRPVAVEVALEQRPQFDEFGFGISEAVND